MEISEAYDYILILITQKFNLENYEFLGFL